MIPHEITAIVKAEAQRRGYRFRRYETDTEIIEQMIRPDGTVAITATMKKSEQTCDDVSLHRDGRS